MPENTGGGGEQESGWSAAIGWHKNNPSYMWNEVDPYWSWEEDIYVINTTSAKRNRASALSTIGTQGPVGLTVHLPAEEHI
jgi:hypothetical protein